VLVQVHCDGGILLDLTLRLAFKQLKANVVSGREENGPVVATYCSVGVVQEILQCIVGFPKRLLENLGQR
jgi:hypothetical protein